MVVVFKVENVPKRKGSSEGWTRAMLVQKNVGVVKDPKEFGCFLNEVKTEGSLASPLMTPHWHKHESLFFILRGRCIVDVEGKEYELGPNSIMWIPPDEKHNIIEVIEDMRMFEIHGNPAHREDIYPPPHAPTH